MGQSLMGLAFGAGLIAVLNPCGFAMLPVYLTLVVRGDGTGRRTALRRGVVATLDMVAGFMTVFGAFGMLTVSAASAAQQYLPYVTVLIGGLLVGVGAWTLTGRNRLWLAAGTRSGRRASTPHGAMVGYGVGYAIASLSCTVGPFLAVTTAGMRDGVLADGLLTYLVYAAGMSLIVGVLAIAAAFANPVGVYRMRRILPYVNRIGGALVGVVGAYVAYYGVYEIRVVGAGAAPADPVISAAGRVQNAVAMWVHTHGGYPWLAALTMLVLGAFVLAWGRMVRRTVRVRRVLALRAGELRTLAS